MSEISIDESYHKELMDKVFKNVLAEHIKREFNKCVNPAFDNKENK